MKNGIIKGNQGFAILVEGAERTFRDVKSVAVEVATLLASQGPGSRVVVLDRATRQR